MHPRSRLALVMSFVVLGCDSMPTRPALPVPSNVVILPRTLLASGATPPRVDSIRYVLHRDRGNDGEVVTRHTVEWSRRFDSLETVVGATKVRIEAYGLKRQEDGTTATWWSGLVDRRLPFDSAQATIRIPVVVSDTTAPSLGSRRGLTSDARDTLLNLGWVVRDQGPYTSKVQGVSILRRGDTTSWSQAWGGDRALTVVAAFRDSSGNLRLDTVRAIRQPLVQAPRFSVVPGTYADIVRLGLSSPTSGAVCEASLDSGRTWAVVDSTLALGRSVRVWARARQAQASTSDTVRGEFQVRAAAPTFSIASGTKAWDVLPVRVVSATPGAKVEVSLDSGRTWTQAPDTLRIDRSIEVQARALKTGLTTSEVSRATYGVTFDPPAFTVPSGTASNDLLTVRIVSKLQGATVEHSLDSGRTWVPYKDSLVLGRSVSLQARASKGGVVRGGTASAFYAVAAAAPTISIPSGTKHADLVRAKVATATPGGIVQVSWDSGSTWSRAPDSLVLGRSVKFLLRSWKQGLQPSPAQLIEYTIALAAPTLSVPTGTQAIDYLPVVVRTSIGGVTTQRSFDGQQWENVPDSFLVAFTTDLFARVIKDGMDPSPFVRASYVVRADRPRISRAGGRCDFYPTLVLQQSTPDAEIRYTLDGSDPTSSSPRFDGSLLIDSSYTLKAATFKPFLAQSEVVTETYDLRVEGTIRSSVPSGTFVWRSVKATLAPSSAGFELRCSKLREPRGTDPICKDAIEIQEGESLFVAAWSKTFPLLEPLREVFWYPSSWISSVPYDSILDARDGRTYRTVKIGEQIWMAENLAYAGVGGDTGRCAINAHDTCAKYGRLYSWGEAMRSNRVEEPSNPVRGLCPEGWHIPSALEWAELARNAGGSDSAGGILKSQAWWNRGAGRDLLGFRALGAGGIYAGNAFNKGEYAEFWSSTPVDSLRSKARFLTSANGRFDESVSYREDGLSLRCLRNE